jgi:hypothetical protein
MKLKAMLDEVNVHAKSFRMARDTLRMNEVQDLKLKLISERTTDESNHNYSCKLHISKTDPNKIQIGKGWRKYVKDNNLKPYDQLMLVLSKPPTSVQVSIVDRS